MSYLDLVYEDITTTHDTYTREALIELLLQRFKDGQVWVPSFTAG